MSHGNHDAEIAARVYRGQAVEAVHYASIAVVDDTGSVTHSLGDPELVTMARSSIKPFQLLPLLTSGAADHFGFTPKQLAIMCGSHNGSDEHREVVLSNLVAAGNTAEHLRCGSHWPIGMQEATVFPYAGEEKDPLRHNCSGKHSGFLALARYLGEDPADYLNPNSRAQRMVRGAVAHALEYPESAMITAVDGCSAPNFSISVRSLAVGFMRLATLRYDDPETAAAGRRVRDAMWSYPEMVSGEGRFDLALARSFSHNVVCKAGAESIQGLGFADPPLGIAVKILDGNWRAMGAIVVDILKQLGLIDSLERLPELQRWERPVVRNNRDIITGYIVSECALRKRP